MPEWIMRHPYVVGAFFAALAAAAAFNTYRAGYVVGQAGILDAVERDAARIASEALGG